MAFLVAKNALELIRPIAVKVQKKDQDIVAASNMIVNYIYEMKYFVTYSLNATELRTSCTKSRFMTIFQLQASKLR